ncbi:MAG: adenosylcobalamin-dependent ribonucleoside-diphosphate reductase [Robiginitalea sp.]
MLSPNAVEILRARYLKRNKAGEVAESPEDLFRRVARAVSAAETRDSSLWEERFYQLMEKGVFLPNSPTLMNAGLAEGQLSACFVLPVADTMQSIFETLKHTALIHQSGGGTGFNFSALRPRGDRTGAGPGSASGPVAFMKVYDEATEQVKQGGRRRGANMGILNITHPDIRRFIESKSVPSALRNFNISVGVSDAFMRAVEADTSWTLLNPRDGQNWGEVPARELWETLCHQAWRTGDPGLLFLDTINKGNPLPELGTLEATNPCGELPLFPYESCNLGSVNLSKMLKTAPDGDPALDWDRLGQVVPQALRFLDDVISVNRFLLPEIQAMTLANRKVGLGVMGWAELLIELGIPYASEEALELGRKLMRFIQEKSFEASESLADEREVFPNWRKSRFFPERQLRNACCNSIAPTGSISVIAGTSYSIEPLYALAFRRVGILEGKQQREINNLVKQVLESRGYWTAEIRAHILEKGGVSEVVEIPKPLRKVLATAHEIPWKYHLAHQQAFQEYTDNAVAKTVNLPGDTPEEEVASIYRTAWEMGLKGITVYRDGSREDQVLQHCKSAISCEL